jgi:hypothetical protein
LEQDCSGVGHPAFRMSSLGGNVVGQSSCLTAVQGSDAVSRTPRLGPLLDNGGPTRTMALSASSPAVGRADLQIPTTDQRGRARPLHHADAGAYQRPSARHRRGRLSPTTSRRAPGIGHAGALQIGMAQA